MILNVKIEVAPALAQMQGLTRQLPFITSLAVDKTAKDALLAEQNAFRTNPGFINRKHSEKTLVMRQRSTKQNPTAVIGPIAERDFLSKFEQGGRDYGQGHDLAVPLAARKTPQASIPASLTPAGLGGKAFKLKTKHGTFLATRISKGAATRRAKKGQAVKGPDPRLVLQYLLEPSVPIKASLHFGVAGEARARANFPIHAKSALDFAISTTKPR